MFELRAARLPEIRSECELAATATAIADSAGFTREERWLAYRSGKADAAKVEACRALMAFGLDPLGEVFLAIRSPERRRDMGAVYTPEAIVKSMVSWAIREGTPERVVDPGCGSGRFTAAAAKAFPDAELVACDIDPLALMLLRARATAQGFVDRLDARLADYRKLRLSLLGGSTLFLGNPPFVRHHKLNPEAKTWFVETARRFGYRASKLSGLHAHFFLRTRELARPGDYGAFVTSAEWLDVNYGSLIRDMLSDGLGGASLHLIAPEAMPFGETMTTGAITCFKVGRRPADFTLRDVASVDELDDLSLGRPVAWDEVKTHRRWSGLIRPAAGKPAGLVELGTLFRAHRGAVTGNNGVFVEGSFAGTLPKQHLIPAVTKGRELFEAGSALRSDAKLKRVIALPSNLAELAPGERAQVEAFLRWARSMGAADSFTARARAAWWAVALRDPAPILCTYMARRAPAFVRNLARARHINIAHGLYPRVDMTTDDLDAYAGWLATHVSITDGRTYAGGLTKFEPKEIERISVPCLEDIRDLHQASLMVRRGTQSGRERRSGTVQGGAPGGAA